MVGRRVEQLTALSASRARKPGYLADGMGLYLQVSPGGGKSWIFRYSLVGRRREMGLGPYPAISLALARVAAADALTMVKTGHDPIDARASQRAQVRLGAARTTTFDEAAQAFLDANEVGWRNDKHRAQWKATLATYVSPVVGSTAISDIGITEVTKILEPLWRSKPETASRVRGRLERILDYGRVRGYRSGENPARWRGNLDKLLPARSAIHRVKHHAALPAKDLPAVMTRLKAAPGVAPLALRFAILTAARAGEVTGATWDEIDLEASLWTVPADRIKAKREHRVPLSREAMSILHQAKNAARSDFVFPGWIKQRPLSLASLSKALRAAGGDNATVHGFRSTFRDWASERTNFPREVAEMALAHAIGNKVEAAYRRGDLLEKRAAMMQEWARFAHAEPANANIVSPHSRKAKGSRKSGASEIASRSSFQISS